MFDLADHWVWDFWVADDGERYHLFFLHAPRSLGNPDRRHDHARIGHAVSDDLTVWTRVADPLPEPRPGFDDLAQWTGTTVSDGDQWWLFTTGRALADDGLVQRIGCATSADLGTWRREDLFLEADPAHYDVGAGEVHWRDPHVVRDDAGTWHLYATARTGGPGSGVVGHAVSDDLRRWEVRPALSMPTGQFAWLEVIQVTRVEDRWVLVFSCLSAEMPHAAAGSGGVWSVPVAGPGAAVDVAGATRLTSEDLYVGKVVTLRDGTSRFLAFRNRDDEGLFCGGVIDPMPVSWGADGRLTLPDLPARWRP